MPTSDEQLATYFQVVKAQCAERGLSAFQLNDSTKGNLGVRLQGATRNWDLYVTCDETSLTLPSLLLDMPRGLLAHVSYLGSVCVNDGQGLSLDPARYAEIVAYTVLAGYDLLERSATDATTGLDEFLNELEGYWTGLPNSRRGRAAFEVDGNDRLISAYGNTAARPPKWYFTERDKAPPSEFYAGKLPKHRALYVHLDTLPTPPEYPEKLTSSFIEAIHEKLSPSQLELWSKLVGPSKNSPKQLAILVSVSRKSGGRSLVGAVFGANHGMLDSKAEVIPLTVRRHTPTYMRERGGASLELLGKHVAVLGCGAVGSVVAETLAAAGVGKLTLVDNDDYSEDNVFRHVLDPMWIDAPKVLGLKFELERKYPGLQVTSEASTAQNWLKTGAMANLDGIVLAFGAPTIERAFSRYFQAKLFPKPVVFTWLEALDLGGHSVLTWGNKRGCLDCLYRDDEGQTTLHPRTSFLEPNQHVSKNLTGCSSVFVPYGALQAHRTALIAAEHMLRALDSETEPSYRFWVGNGTAAAQEGLKTTNWWKVASHTSPAEATSRVFGRPCKHCRGLS